MINSCPINATPNEPRAQLHSPPEVALAILYQDGRLLLQLRDDIPTILYPGCWAVFGGHLEVGESPFDAVIREIWEEIGFKLTEPSYFRPYSDRHAIRHVFSHPLTVPLSQLNLQEGWDFGLASPADIDQGQVYSAVAKAFKPIGDRHRTILLDFLKNKGIEKLDRAHPISEIPHPTSPW